MTRLTGTPRKIILTPSPKTILYLTYFIGLWIISIGCGSGVEDKVNTLFWIMQINFTEKDLTV